MALDLAALKAKLAAKKLEEQVVAVAEVTSPVPEPIKAEPVKTETPAPVQTITSTNTIGTERTSPIEHLDFLTKMDELAAAIHHTHPHMPVLLMKIHKIITADPELVSILSEEQIGVIVNGLKIQTKTELVGTIVKQTKSRDKKVKLDASMF